MKLKKYFLLFVFTLLTVCLTNKANSQVMINEYSCSNIATATDNFSNTPDWIELYNAAASPANIGGYYLTDKISNLTKWAFPAGTTISANGFLRVWASAANTVVGTNIHTNFKLTQTKPEALAFSTPGGVVIDSMTLKPNLTDHSRGRTTNGAATWGVFTTPHTRSI